MGMCVIPVNMLIDNPEIKFCVSVFVCICFAPEKVIFFISTGRELFTTLRKNPFPLMTIQSNVDLWHFNKDISPFAVAVFVGSKARGDRQWGTLVNTSEALVMHLCLPALRGLTVLLRHVFALSLSMQEELPPHSQHAGKDALFREMKKSQQAERPLPTAFL